MADDVISLSDLGTNPFMDDIGAASSPLENMLTGTVSTWQANAIAQQTASDVAAAGGGLDAQASASNEVQNFLSTYWPAQSPATTLSNSVASGVSDEVNSAIANLFGNLSPLIVWGALILFVIVIVATFAGSRR